MSALVFVGSAKEKTEIATAVGSPLRGAGYPDPMVEFSRLYVI